MAVFSICIPTYNRSGYLYFTLKSIVEQDIFKNTNDVEIVISDNCSSDLTEEISKLFVEQFPGKIIYNRNSENIIDKNFEKALSLGHGEVLKLHNDNFVFVEGALEKIVNEIKNRGSDKPVIFFANGNSPLKKDTLCENMDELIQSASYLMTWIAAFSINKEDFDKMDDFAKNADMLLTQVDVLLRMSSGGKKILVYNESVFEGQGVLNKGGYNIPKIFGKNYLWFLKPYLNSGQISKKVYEAEKKSLLLNHIIPMKFSSSRRDNKGQYKNDGYWRHLTGDYWYNFYFYTSIIKIFRLMLDAELNLMGRKLNKNSYQKYWRKRNRHNATTISKGVDVAKVFVGKGVSGNIDVAFGDNSSGLLIIGDNVTIEDGVKFIFEKNALIIIKDGTIIKEDSIIKSGV